MQKLLVEANRCKIRGYKTITLPFALHLVNTIYPDSPGKVKQFERKFKSNLDKNGDVVVAKYTSGLVSPLKTLARADENVIVDRIYKLAQINASYKELAFVMFYTGVVDTRDFLIHFRDIGYILSRMCVTAHYNRQNNTVDKRFSISYSAYNDFMAVLLELSLKGVDFGFYPLDFVYHMLEHTWQRNGNKETEYDYLIRVLEKVDLSGLENLKLTENVINKYYEELAILLPYMVKYIEDKNRFRLLFHKLLKLCNYKYKLLEALVITPEIFENEGVVCCELL